MGAAWTGGGLLELLTPAGAMPWLAGSLVAVAALTVFWRPISGLLRLAGRTGAGLCFLALFAPVGKLLGVGLGVNLANALVLGVLGVPGFGLLMLLRWLLV